MISAFGNCEAIFAEVGGWETQLPFAGSECNANEGVNSCFVQELEYVSPRFSQNKVDVELTRDDVSSPSHSLQDLSAQEMQDREDKDKVTDTPVLDPFKQEPAVSQSDVHDDLSAIEEQLLKELQNVQSGEKPQGFWNKGVIGVVAVGVLGAGALAFLAKSLLSKKQ